MSQAWANKNVKKQDLNTKVLLREQSKLLFQKNKLRFEESRKKSKIRKIQKNPEKIRKSDKIQDKKIRPYLINKMSIL